MEKLFGRVDRIACDVDTELAEGLLIDGGKDRRRMYLTVAQGREHLQRFFGAGVDCRRDRESNEYLVRMQARVCATESELEALNRLDCSGGDELDVIGNVCKCFQRIEKQCGGATQKLRRYAA